MICVPAPLLVMVPVPSRFPANQERVTPVGTLRTSPPMLRILALPKPDANPAIVSLKPCMSNVVVLLLNVSQSLSGMMSDAVILTLAPALRRRLPNQELAVWLKNQLPALSAISVPVPTLTGLLAMGTLNVILLPAAAKNPCAVPPGSWRTPLPIWLIV